MLEDLIPPRLFPAGVRVNIKGLMIFMIALLQAVVTSPGLSASQKDAGVQHLPIVFRTNAGADANGRVASFEVSAGSGSIMLAWETNHEVDVAGFYIRRAGSPFGPYDSWTAIVVTDLDFGGDHLYILARNESGAEYHFADPDVVMGERYYYVLEVVFHDASREFVGPKSAAPN